MWNREGFDPINPPDPLNPTDPLNPKDPFNPFWQVMEMANWRYKINLTDLREDYENKKITVEDFGKKISKRFHQQPWFKDVEEDIGDIIDSFECVDNEDDFNNILEELYDWGDTELPTPRSQLPIFNKMCWIGLM